MTESPRNDQADVKSAQKNRSAFAPLYERYADIFAKAIGTIGTFRGASFRGWLFTIARNAVIDRYRARRPVTELSDSLVSSQRSPEDIAMQRETRLELRAALSHLTDQQQDVITLRLAGLSGKEIAAAMNMSLGAVKATQVRAFARLRELMSHVKEGAHE